MAVNAPGGSEAKIPDSFGSEGARLKSTRSSADAGSLAQSSLAISAVNTFAIRTLGKIEKVGKTERHEVGGKAPEIPDPITQSCSNSAGTLIVWRIVFKDIAHPRDGTFL
jgi:hypothetical protein